LHTDKIKLENSMNNQLTVLIPTSPIPSHPSTAILDETIENIRKVTDAQIIVMFDGVHSSLKHREAAYNEYKENVKKQSVNYGSFRILDFDKHSHQAIMTRIALGHISTPLIMFCEHDTSPIGEIPMIDLCRVVKNSGNINYVRFNIFESVPKEHDYLMIGDTEVVLSGKDEDDISGEDERRFLFKRTIQYSQRPHIAKTDWYRRILTKYFKPEFKGMIEDVMHSVVQVEYNDKGEDSFGLAIYTPEGNQLRSYHSDGRGQDEKIIEA
jgi:oligoribonuclease (3'-5' exoribonuclease)